MRVDPEKIHRVFLKDQIVFGVVRAGYFCFFLKSKEKVKSDTKGAPDKVFLLDGH